jgi:hypothetical protein
MKQERARERRKARLPYHPPELREYGTIVSLTGGLR